MQNIPIISAAPTSLSSKFDDGRPVTLIPNKQIALVPESEIEKLVQKLNKKEIDAINRLEEISCRPENADRMLKFRILESVVSLLNEKNDPNVELKLFSIVSHVINKGLLLLSISRTSYF